MLVVERNLRSLVFAARAMLPAMACICSPPAFAVDAQQACTSKATEMLPESAGMTLGRTRAKTLQAPEEWSGRGLPFLVELDFNAAGTVGTHRFWCVVKSDGEIILQRLTQ
jgi:hypothetical protein